MTTTPTPPARMPLEYLEELAADQRRNIHNSVSKLRVTARQRIKERLDVRRNLKRYFWPAAAVASLVGLAVGYNFTGMFTDR